jgi:hypothetical protein
MAKQSARKDKPIHANVFSKNPTFPLLVSPSAHKLSTTHRSKANVEVVKLGTDSKTTKSETIDF